MAPESRRRRRRLCPVRVRVNGVVERVAVVEEAEAEEVVLVLVLVRRLSKCMKHYA